MQRGIVDMDESVAVTMKLLDDLVIFGDVGIDARAVRYEELLFR